MVPTYTVGWWLNEPQFRLRGNMVSFEKAFNLYAFVDDVHSNKLINISYFTKLFKRCCCSCRNFWSCSSCMYRSSAAAFFFLFPEGNMKLNHRVSPVFFIWHVKDFGAARDGDAEGLKNLPMDIRWITMHSRMARCLHDPRRN